MVFRFIWSDEKAEKNLKKHQVSFEEAISVFGDPLGIAIPDPLHSQSEDRFVVIGRSEYNRVIVAVFIERDHKVRIISARKATPKERRNYEENR